jgi:hypothetical protein
MFILALFIADQRALGEGLPAGFIPPPIVPEPVVAVGRGGSYRAKFCASLSWSFVAAILSLSDEPF